jgi:hypothetical protein
MCSSRCELASIITDREEGINAPVADMRLSLTDAATAGGLSQRTGRKFDGVMSYVAAMLQKKKGLAVKLTLFILW